MLEFNSSDQLVIKNITSGSTNVNLITNAVFREIKPDIEKLKNGKKQQAMISIGSGTAAGGIISIISNILIKAFTQ